MCSFLGLVGFVCAWPTSGQHYKASCCYPRPPLQVLPLSLSVDFLGLVLAVVDDHARSQGQGSSAGSTATKPSAIDDASSPEITLAEPGAVAAEEAGSLGGEGGLEEAGMVAAVHGADGEGGAAAPAHATAVRFLSLGDLPRLYNRPGAIIRNLVKACKGDAPSGEVKCESFLGYFLLASSCSLGLFSRSSLRASSCFFVKRVKNTLEGRGYKAFRASPPHVPCPSTQFVFDAKSTACSVLPQVDGMPLADFLELSSLAMTDPISGSALVPGGEDTDVTMDNVGEFVEAVTARYGTSRLEKSEKHPAEYWVWICSRKWKRIVIDA